MKQTSKIKLSIFLFLICHFLSTSINAQTTAVQNSDFEEINQNWIGELKYLNYGDDKSIVSIPCSLKTDFTNGKIKSIIEFDELNKKGKKMTSKTKFQLSKNGKYFKVNREKWEVISTKNSHQSIQIIAQKKGKDNNQSADLRITWTLEKGKSISWKKDVRYAGTDIFFNRNYFNFSKI